MEKQIIQRKENWTILLSEYLLKIKDKPFKWGSNDCCFMPANCVKELTGFDPAKEFRQKVKNKDSAQEILNKHKDVKGLITYCMGFEPSELIFNAKRGDVIVCEIQEKLCGGIVDDSGYNVLLFEEKNLKRYPLNIIKYVWSY